MIQRMTSLKFNLFKSSVFMAVAIILLVSTNANATRQYPEGFDPSYIPSDVQSHKYPSNRTDESIRQIPFFDNIENGLNEWTSTGFWHQVVNPQNISINSDILSRYVQLPDTGFLPSAYSGSTCWWYGEDITGTFIGSNYDLTQADLSGGESISPNTGTLISPRISLATATASDPATLSFASWWEIEGVDVNTFDMMYVEISTDNGQNYNILATINPLDDANSLPYICYSSAGINMPGTWGTTYIDLSQYTGQTVNIRFRFDTRDSLYNGFRGWFIDDVRVTTSATPTIAVNSVNPSTAKSGDIVSIYGSGFIRDAVVLIGTYQVESTKTSVISHNQVDIYVPVGIANGTYDIKVTNPDDASATLQGGLTISNAVPPSIQSVSPVSGINSQTTSITISGSNFVSGATVGLSDTSLSNVIVVSAASITATVPAGLSPGNYNLIVTNPDGLQDTKYIAFEVINGNINGSIAGTVRDSQTGNAISGALITFAGSAVSHIYTDQNGLYTASDLPPGNYMITATSPGHIEATQNIELLSGQNITADFTLATIGGGSYRIVLSWGQSPSDLDSHMWVPTGNTECGHIYYPYSSRGSQDSFPFAQLDVDDVSSYGPETITIYQNLPGVYQYWVYNYSGSPDIITSEATVSIYNGDSLLKSYTIPTNMEGQLAWHVFDIAPQSGEITDVNLLQPDYQNGTCINTSTPQCILTISPAVQNVDSNAGSNNTISVIPHISNSPLANCSWTATTTADWISITSGQAGNGNGTVQYSVVANTSGEPRNASIEVAGQTFTVIQSGAVVCQDEYEGDNTSSEAKQILPGESQQHRICPIGDQDWVKFTLTTPSAVVLETSGPSGDTEMWLYDANQNQIAYNDNKSQLNTFSKIEKGICNNDLFPSIPAGTYYVKVAERGGDSEIFDYTLSINVIPCGFDVLTPQLTLSSVNGVAGGTVLVSLVLNNVEGTTIAAVSTDITFDPTLLEFKTALIGPAGTSAGKAVTKIILADGHTVRIGVVSPNNNNVIGNGVIASVTFQIKSTVPDGTIIPLIHTANGSTPAGDEVTLNGIAGSITIGTCALLGDCNCNGSVSIAEVQSAINMYLEINPVLSCCDRDGNGTVSVAEVQTIINNYLEIVAPVGHSLIQSKNKQAQVNIKNESEGYSLTLLPNGNNIGALSIDVAYPEILTGRLSFSIGTAAENAGKKLVQNEISPGLFRIGVISISDNQKINSGEILSIHVDGGVGENVVNFSFTASDQFGKELTVKNIIMN